MGKLIYYQDKTLKLVNVLQYKVLLNTDEIELQTTIEQMQAYIRKKRLKQIGPLIHYSKAYLDDCGEVIMDYYLMVQCDKTVDKIEEPYSMEKTIRVPNALYCRYIGPEEKMNIAFEKIHVEAFEQDIELANCQYTVILDNNVEEDIFMADIFVPRV